MEPLTLLDSFEFKILCCFIGWFFHLWVVGREMSAARHARIWPHQVILERPMRCAISSFGAFWLFLGLLDVQAIVPALPVFTAFTCAGVGFMSEKGVDISRKLFAKRLGLTDEEIKPTRDLTEPTVLRTPRKAREEEL